MLRNFLMMDYVLFGDLSITRLEQEQYIALTTLL